MKNPAHHRVPDFFSPGCLSKCFIQKPPAYLTVYRGCSLFFDGCFFFFFCLGSLRACFQIGELVVDVHNVFHCQDEHHQTFICQTQGDGAANEYCKAVQEGGFSGGVATGVVAVVIGPPFLPRPQLSVSVPSSSQLHPPFLPQKPPSLSFPAS